MEDHILKNTKSRPSKLVKPIFPLAGPVKNEHETSKYINHTSYNTPGKNILGEYMIKILLGEPCRIKYHYWSKRIVYVNGDER